MNLLRKTLLFVSSLGLAILMGGCSKKKDHEEVYGPPSYFGYDDDDFRGNGRRGTVHNKQKNDENANVDSLKGKQTDSAIPSPQNMEDSTDIRGDFSEDTD